MAIFIPSVYLVQVRTFLKFNTMPLRRPAMLNDPQDSRPQYDRLPVNVSSCFRSVISDLECAAAHEHVLTGPSTPFNKTTKLMCPQYCAFIFISFLIYLIRATSYLFQSSPGRQGCSQPLRFVTENYASLNLGEEFR
jgi:hypothetical protein